jgi:hypothetical protein
MPSSAGDIHRRSFQGLFRRHPGLNEPAMFSRIPTKQVPTASEPIAKRTPALNGLLVVSRLCAM